jgi:hypothetical protein
MEHLGTSTMKGLSTPGVEGKDEEDNDDDKELEKEQAHSFRRIAARCNYLAMDRPDIQYSVKEVCRDMSKPTSGSLRRLKRIGCYLKRKPRLIWKFDTQEEQYIMNVYTDANWAGCRKTRKSTSGGVIMLGMHCLRTWAKTQAVRAKSSAESELYAAVRVGCEGLGALTMMSELGKNLSMRLHIDSTAAKAILERVGLQKIRHLDVDTLWMQDLAAKEHIDIRKIPGDKNVADLMTKHLNLGKIDDYCHRINVMFREGRSEKSAKLYMIREKGDKRGGEDAWGQRGGEGGQWSRIHRDARRSLFAPGCADKGPSSSRTLTSTRKTKGKFIDGKTFTIIDDWRDQRSTHRSLEKSWTGETTFYEWHE